MKIRILVVLFALLVGTLWALPPAAAAQTKGKLMEEIVARVNNEIVTLSDFEKADATLHQEVTQDCQNCTPDKIAEEYNARRKNLLRDLIDQSLLVQRAKDLNISVETELVKRLDEVRIQNNLPSMEDLEKAVEAQGISWEDYKTSLRNSLLTQEVVRREVGSRINIGSDEVKKYYDQHQTEFNRPEQVVLSEIFLSTEGKSPEEIAGIRKKAEEVLARVKKGEDFSELAKRNSQGQTAKDGGDLGAFERGQLAPQLEDVVFKMNRSDVSGVIQTKTGFEILKVVQHFQAGQQPMDKVENEILNKLYSDRIQPELRKYLAELREQSYVIVKPGYADTAAVSGNTVIQETAPTADEETKKTKKPRRPSS